VPHGVPPKRIEVAVHTAQEKYPTSLTDQNDLYINMDPSLVKPTDKSDGPNFDDDVESGVSNK
jgi:hypothetical protein